MLCRIPFQAAMDSASKARYLDRVTGIHALANPARFLKIAKPLTPIFCWLGVILVLIGAYGGLVMTPPDYLQKESVRIIYIHIPAAWLGMGGWSGIAISSLVFLIWRHPISHLASRAIAPAGLLFTALCLVTGSIWGRPTWGTWWEWDGRLTSMLLLLFVYIAYIALARADADRGGDGRVPALFGVAGSVLLPVIRYSVVWWNTLHQGQSIGLTRTSIDSSMFWPLYFTITGFTLIFGGVVLMQMRAMLANQKVEARMRRMAAQ